jgi:uncharacterized membrane protein
MSAGSGPVTTDTDPVGQTFVVWPHRSLGRGGTVALLGSVAIGFGYVVLATAGIEHWPVLLASVATGLGLAAALWCSNRAAVAREIIEVTPRVVRVTRIDRSTIGEPVEFSADWVRIQVSTDRYLEDRVLLREGTRRLSIGGFLSPVERRSLADELARSIARQRAIDA